MDKYKKKENYFKDAQAKEDACYKLWIAWLPQYESKWGGRKVSVWYSYNKRKNQGLDWLQEKAKELRTEFKVAHIYDNKTGNLLYSIPGADQTYIQKQQTNTGQQ